MKKITELSEQEILSLTDDDVRKIINYRKAEEGIKFIEYPAKPEFEEVFKPKTKVYYCHLLGQKLSFSNLDELNRVIEVLNECQSICSIESNYDMPEGYKYFMKAKVENASYSSEAPDSITPLTVYTNKEYNEIREQLKENTRVKNDYQTKVKEYHEAVNNAQWISDEIWERVNKVREKFRKLNDYCLKLKNEYLLLAENNLTIALNFLDRAYKLNEEELAYVESNYNLL